MTYLDTAVTIGRQIADAAIWHGRRCTWVGAMPEEGPVGPRMTYASFGPDLYGGTAGVALAAAELYAASGESLFEAVAVGAIEHALSRVGDLPPGASLGRYTGRPGWRSRRLASACCSAGRIFASGEPRSAVISIPGSNRQKTI